MLSALPEELVEWIVGHLDLESIRALRLTNRAVAHKCSNGYFASLFRRKTVRLTKLSLEHAAQVMPTRGRYIQELCVAGAVQSEEATPEPRAVYEDHSESLADLFKTLKRCLGTRSLRRLSLALDQDDDTPPPRFRRISDYWRPAHANPTVAAHTSLTVAGTIFKALQRSQLRIEELELAKFYVPLNVFEHIQDLESLAPSLGTVKELTLSFSHSLLPENIEARPSDRHPSELVSNLCKFLDMAKAVQRLDLHWFRLRGEGAGSGDDAEEENFFEICQTSIAALPLERCALRGLSVTEAGLVEFLNTTSARSLLLQHIRLRAEGRYVPILKILTRSENPFNEFHLDDLFEKCHGYRLVHFRVRGKQKFPVKGARGPSEVYRKGKGVPRSLSYEFSSRPLGSGKHWRWEGLKSVKFGPSRCDFLPPFMEDARSRD